MTKFVIVIANETTLNAVQVIGPFATQGKALDSVNELAADRKSTRLNSSHTVISYAVFCLKKKNPKVKKL